MNTQKILFLLTLMSSIILFIFHYDSQPIALEIEGELPYGFSMESFKEYLNKNLNSNLSTTQGLYSLLNQMQHYHSIVIKRTQPYTLTLMLLRKKSLATCSQQRLLLEDGSVIHTFSKEKMNYHIQLMTDNDCYKKNLLTIIESLQQHNMHSAVITLQVTGNVSVVLPDDRILLLPAYRPKEKLESIFEYFGNQLPVNYQIDGRYERGFVFNKKQSARI